MDPWAAPSAPDPPAYQDTPGSPNYQDTSDSPNYQDTSDSPNDQDTSALPDYRDGPGSPNYQDMPALPDYQYTPGPPDYQDMPGPPARQDTSGPRTRQDTSGPRARRDAAGPRTRARPALPPAAAPDPSDDTFAADGPRAAATAEFLPPNGLLSDESPAPRRTPRRTPRAASHGVLIFALVATLTSLAAAGAGAWWITSHQARLRPTSAGTQSPSSSASAPAASAPAASGSPGASDAVAVAPALAGEPAAPRVAALLKAYFGAINRHDYATFAQLFIPDIRESQQNFDTGYRSTTDSAATLVGLSPTGAQGLAATVTFTSHQDAADSPDHATCDAWNVVLSLTGTSTGPGYLIDRSPAGYQPTVRACR